jgi:putative tryptophan/tyrosine transport system substrate-binding protein
MRRREFITLLGCGLALRSPALRAQPAPVPMVGFMHVGGGTTLNNYFKRIIAAFSDGLKENGYIEGETIAIEYRWGEGRNDRLPALAEDLVAHHAAAILAAGGTEPARVAMSVTKTIPIVFISATDPVATGLVASLNRPSGNVTGVSMVGAELDAKRIEMLRRLLPTAATIGVLYNPNYPGSVTQLSTAQDAASHLGLKLVLLRAEKPDDIEPAFTAAAQQGIGAVLMVQSPFFIGIAGQVAQWAARHKLPVMYSQRDYVAAGGLISYGPSFPEGYRQAGVYIGRILKGEKPSNLPVVQPTNFELAINVKAAKELNIEVSPTLLALADEVIE